MTQYTKADVQIEKQEVLYDAYFRVIRYTLRHKLHEGGWTDRMTRENFMQGDAAAVILYDPDKDTILLGEQFRIGAIKEENPWLLEVVAGRFEPGESPEDVAIRESEEEMRATVKKLIPMFDFYSSPGGTNEKVYYYCGIIDSTNMAGVCGLKEEHEDIAVGVYALEDAIRMVNENQIKDGIALIGIQWLCMNRERLRELYRT